MHHITVVLCLRLLIGASSIRAGSESKIVLVSSFEEVKKSRNTHQPNEPTAVVVKDLCVCIYTMGASITSLCRVSNVIHCGSCKSGTHQNNILVQKFTEFSRPYQYIPELPDLLNKMSQKVHFDEVVLTVISKSMLHLFIPL